MSRRWLDWSGQAPTGACSHAATLNEEEFELDTATDTIFPKNKNLNFLSKVEEQIDATDHLQVERNEKAYHESDEIHHQEKRRKTRF